MSLKEKNMKRSTFCILCSVFCVLAGPALANVTDSSRTTSSACDNSTTGFAFSFPITATSDLQVILRTVATGAETVLTETTDYTVSATNNDYSAGGTVTTVSTYSSAYTLTIRGATPKTQATDLEDRGVLRLEAIEDALDKLTMIVQELAEELARAVRVPRTEAGATTELDDSVNRASKVLGFDSSGNTTALSAVPSGSVSVSAFMQTVLDDADAAAAKATLDLPTIAAFAETFLDDTTAAGVRTTIGAVGLTGNETVAGNKTFSGNTTLSGTNTIGDGSVMASSAAPSTDAMIANKKYVDDGHKPYARMFLTAAQNNLTDVTWTTIALDTDTFDSGTITDLASYKITPGVAGYYMLLGQVTFTNVIAEKTYSAQLYFNGTTAKQTATQQNGAATTDVVVNVVDVIYFDADDYIQLRGYVNCGAATVDIDPGTENTNLTLYRL